MGRWAGKIRAHGLVLDAEIWYETPERTHQGLRWHGVIPAAGTLKGAGARRLQRELASPEAACTIETDVGTIQIDTVAGERITFHGCGAPAGGLAEAIGG